MNAPKRALIIVRESNENLAAGWSPDQYVAKCREKAAALGAVVIEPPLIEIGKRNEWDSPKFLEAVRLAEDGAYDYLISPDTARLAGDPGKMLWLKRKLAEVKVEIHYANQEFSRTAEGDLQELILSGFDSYERMKIAMRFANGRAGKLAARVPIGSGRTPYGAEKVYDERGRAAGYRADPERVAVLRRIVSEARTRSLGDIADDLNAEGVATPGGAARWQSSTVYKLIVNPIYGGEYRWGRRRQEPKRRADGRRWWKRVENDASNVTTIAIEPLVDPSEIAAARAALTGRKRVRRARRAEEDDPFTLRGALSCGHCGGALSVSGGAKRYYLCQRAYARKSGLERSERCPLPNIPAEALEAHAWGGLRVLLEDDAAFEGELAKAADGGEAAARHAEQIAVVAAKVAKLRSRLASGARSLREFDPESETYATLLAGQQADERQKAVLERSLSSLEAARPVTLSATGVAEAREARQTLLLGLDEAGDGAAAQRALYRAIRVRGIVRLDAAGVRIGRKHLLGVEWLDPDGVHDGAPLLWKCGAPYILITPTSLRVRPVA